MGRRSWHVLAALVLATGALGALSIQAVRREAEVRRKVVVDTHREVADLVSNRLAGALADDARVIGEAVSTSGDNGDKLAGALDDIETARPWLRPLVVSARAGIGRESPGAGVRGGDVSTATSFRTLLEAAERDELRMSRLDSVVRQYARAAEQAPTNAARLQALNGLARTEFRAGRFSRARDASRQLLESADNLEPEEARWSLFAHDRLLECDAKEGDLGARRQHALEFYAFLLRFRYVLDRDAADYYARRASDVINEGPLSPAQQVVWRSLQDREALLTRLDEPIRRQDLAGSGGPAAAVVYPIEAHVDMTLRHVLDEAGPWTEMGIALVDTSVASGRLVSSPVDTLPADATAATSVVPQLSAWRVMAFPRSGSLEDLAARDVTRYALWLLLVCGTVVTALVLAARSVSRELALSRLRAEFVAGVSHELKTPLSLIRMFAESLREGWVDEARKKEYYEVITRESERLTGLINNVLDFSRLESGTRRYALDRVDIRQLMCDLLDRYEFHLRAASIELLRDLPDRPVFVRADRDAIEQVAVNLLSNAVKYMRDTAEGPRQVRVALAHDAQSVVLRVSDTGIGMSDEQRSHIFERFYRSDDKRVRSVAGSGLGLTLVKAHVDAHAGSIDVESAPGQGSTFAVRLPLAVEGTSA